MLPACCPAILTHDGLTGRPLIELKPGSLAGVSLVQIARRPVVPGREDSAVMVVVYLTQRIGFGVRVSGLNIRRQ